MPSEFRKCLVRLGAWCTSSCSLERLFSTAELTVGPERKSLTDGNFEDELLLIDLKDERTWPALIDGARSLWVQFFGNVRRPYMRRRQKPSKPQAEHSEIALIQKRRDAIGTFVKTTSPGARQQGPASSSADLWGPSHTKENNSMKTSESMLSCLHALTATSCQRSKGLWGRFGVESSVIRQHASGCRIGWHEDTGCW